MLSQLVLIKNIVLNTVKTQLQGIGRAAERKSGPRHMGGVRAPLAQLGKIRDWNKSPPPPVFNQDSWTP